MSEIPPIRLAPDDAEVVIRASDDELVLDIPESKLGQKITSFVQFFGGFALLFALIDWFSAERLIDIYYPWMLVMAVGALAVVLITRRKRLYLNRKEGSYLLLYKPLGVPLFSDGGDLDDIEAVVVGGDLPLALSFADGDKREIAGLTSVKDRRWAKEQIEAFINLS